MSQQLPELLFLFLVLYLFQIVKRKEQGYFLGDRTDTYRRFPSLGKAGSRELLLDG